MKDILLIALICIENAAAIKYILKNYGKTVIAYINQKLENVDYHVKNIYEILEKEV